MRSSDNDLTALILAAGQSTRIKSSRSKVVHEIGGKRLLDWVLSSVYKAGIKNRIVVCGKQPQEIVDGLPEDVSVAIQDKALGTGHAVQSAKAVFGKKQGILVVLCGDAPLIRPQTLRQLIKQHKRLKAKATILTAQVDNPFGYGRICRHVTDNRFVSAIIEEKEANEQEKAICEINSGAYCFSLDVFWKALGRIKNKNSKGEFYLTDVIALLGQDGHRVAAVQVEDVNEILGVNTRKELSQANAILNERVLDRLMLNGVSIMDPASTWIEEQVVIGQDTIIYPGTIVTGKTRIGKNCKVGPYCEVEDSIIGSGCQLRQSLIERSQLGSRVHVGPYAHLRPGNKIASDVHIGNFVEINRSDVKENVKIGHVSYIGDTTIGDKTNIGAGTITANYDGCKKHKTVIGSQSFVGSGSVLVAPNKIGKEALIGAGAVVKAHTTIPAKSVAVGVPARVIKKKK